MRPSTASRSTRRRPSGPGRASAQRRSAPRRRCCGRTTRRWRSTSSRRSRSSTTATFPSHPAIPSARTAQVEEALTPVVEAGVFPLALGGDHSVTLAELRVLARKHGPLALVQLDAHGDTWDEYFGQRYFHGTTFLPRRRGEADRPSASVQAGLRGSLYAADGPRVGARHGLRRAAVRRSCGRLGPAATRASSANASVIVPSSSRSTSTSSTRRSRPAPGRRRSAGSRRPKRLRSCVRCAGSTSSAPTSSRSRPPTTAPASRRRSPPRTSPTSCSACALSALSRDSGSAASSGRGVPTDRRRGCGGCTSRGGACAR